MLSIDECIKLFELSGNDNILEETHFGIVNGTITTNVLNTNVLSFRTLFAPPFASSDFRLDLRLFGELVKTTSYTWKPTEVHREGKIRGPAHSKCRG